MSALVNVTVISTNNVSDSETLTDTCSTTYTQLRQIYMMLYHNKMGTAHAIGHIKAYVDLDVSLRVCQLDDGHLQ